MAIDERADDTITEPSDDPDDRASDERCPVCGGERFDDKLTRKRMANLNPKPKRISRSTLAIVLGERLGEDVHPRNVRLHRPDWLLHRCEEFDCVELYRLPLGLCAEAWTDIPTSESPFVRNNGAAFARAMIKVEAEYCRIEGATS